MIYGRYNLILILITGLMLSACSDDKKGRDSGGATPYLNGQCYRGVNPRWENPSQQPSADPLGNQNSATQTGYVPPCSPEEMDPGPCAPYIYKWFGKAPVDYRPYTDALNDLLYASGRCAGGNRNCAESMNREIGIYIMTQTVHSWARAKVYITLYQNKEANTPFGWGQPSPVGYGGGGWGGGPFGFGGSPYGNNSSFGPNGFFGNQCNSYGSDPMSARDIDPNAIDMIVVSNGQNFYQKVEIGRTELRTNDFLVSLHRIDFRAPNTGLDLQFRGKHIASVGAYKR